MASVVLQMNVTRPHFQQRHRDNDGNDELALTNRLLFRWTNYECQRRTANGERRTEH